MAKKRKKAAKRELIDTGRDKRYVRRGARGDSRRSTTSAAHSPLTGAEAKTGAKPGQGDKGPAAAERNSYSSFISCERTTSSFCLKRLCSLWRWLVPPLSVYAPHHHFKNDHVVALGLSVVLPQALGRRAHIGSDATKPLHERSRSVAYIRAGNVCRCCRKAAERFGRASCTYGRGLDSARVGGASTNGSRFSTACRTFGS